jgi:hypothetical protein
LEEQYFHSKLLKIHRRIHGLATAAHGFYIRTLARRTSTIRSPIAFGLNIQMVFAYSEYEFDFS